MSKPSDGPAESDAEHAHDEPPSDEPQTPMWLPLLGGALFLLLIVLFVVTRPAGKTEAELSREAAGASSAEPSASASAAAPKPVVPSPAAPAPQAGARGAAGQRPRFPILRPLRPHPAVPPH